MNLFKVDLADKTLRLVLGDFFEFAQDFCPEFGMCVPEFFRHAETSSWLVKPVLLYYGMLSVAKACLTFAIPDFFLTDASMKHGINRVKAGDEPNLKSAEINIQDQGVFQLARRAIGGVAVPGNTKVRLDDVLQRLPEITVAYGLASRRFEGEYARITSPWVAHEKIDEPFHIVFDLPREFVEAKKALLPSALLTDFKVIEPDKASLRYVSKAGWETQEVAQFQISRATLPFLSSTLDGRAAFFLPISAGKSVLQFTELELLYLVIFYLSEVARYMPHVWLQLQEGQENFAVLLCQEVLRSCENKFLQLVQQRMVYAITLPFGPLIQGKEAADS